ncbi:MAG TPA: thioredoxin family protein [Labilithrix sp.]|nr:thioredoxin family protein [Labilithrix sp.]
MRSSLLAVCLAALTLAACKDGKEPAVQNTTGAAASPVTPAPPVTPAAAAEHAEVGKPAPDFALKDLDGKEVRLSSFKGKTVVLEWFNPGCPFVKAAHTKGSLKDAARRQAKNGVVWLAVNSGAPGKQGAGLEANREGAKTFAMENPILLDEAGTVGRTYGATNTPHVMVVDDKGTLVYRGAVDNSPDGEGESPTGGKLVSYVEAALADLGAGKPVATAETRAYGCSVKYGR